MNDTLKIGQSTRSGHARAKDLNREASTGLPAEYRCIFQYETPDCGRAERIVHRELAQYRRGKRGQEFFLVELDIAKKSIISACDGFKGEFIIFAEIKSKPMLTPTEIIHAKVSEGNPWTESKKLNTTIRIRKIRWSAMYIRFVIHTIKERYFHRS